MKSIDFVASRRRLILVALALLFGFGLLILQFFNIQVIQHEKWSSVALSQHQTVHIESFKRGRFFSNTSIKKGHPEKEQPLVIDVPKFHFHVDPKGIKAPLRDEIAEKIATYFSWDEKAFAKGREQFDKLSRSRRLAAFISPEMKEEIETWWYPFAKKHKMPRNALFFVQDFQRCYPFGHLLGNVLHTVRKDRDESTGQAIPTGGLELIFDPYLRGKGGKKLQARSPRHEMDVGKVLLKPEDGADVYLTINHTLQAIAEEEIEKQVKKAEAKGGWAVMMDPYSGEVLALAQYPFFDPSQYAAYFNDKELLDYTKVRAVTDPYEPGSIMKAVTMAICLKANEELIAAGRPPIFDPEAKMDVRPGPLPGRTKPLKDFSNHKTMNMDMAIQKSSNVYMGKMVRRVIDELGTTWYRNALQNIFGFGVKTGIELPAESPGLLPTPGKLHPNGTLEWSAPTPYSLAMGHNVLANSIQMAKNLAIIINGGYDVKPTLVKKIALKGKSLYERPPVERKQLLSPAISARLVRAMKYVTKPGGAASKGDIFGYSEGGKTGTSEKIIDGVYSKKNHISTFLGFAPASHPRFVLMIVIDEPAWKWIPGVGSNQFGGNCAAPAFRRIGLKSLQYLGVPPDDPFGFPVGDPRRDPIRGDWLVEVADLKKKYDEWNK